MKIILSLLLLVFIGGCSFIKKEFNQNDVSVIKVDTSVHFQTGEAGGGGGANF